MSTATMGDLNDISCKTCAQLKIIVLKALCCLKNSVKKELSFQLFLYLNSEYVSEKDLSNQSLLNNYDHILMNSLRVSKNRLQRINQIHNRFED